MRSKGKGTGQKEMSNKFKGLDDRPLTPKEAEAFLKELEAKEIEELREWSKTAEQAIILLTRENKRLRRELEAILEFLNGGNE